MVEVSDEAALDASRDVEITVHVCWCTKVCGFDRNRWRSIYGSTEIAITKTKDLYKTSTHILLFPTCRFICVPFMRRLFRQITKQNICITNNQYSPNKLSLLHSNDIGFY